MNPKEEGLRSAGVRFNPETEEYTWSGEAHGVRAYFTSADETLEIFISPIFTMREKGVALVDQTGTMRVNRRRDR
jgi:hypothetical protein